MVCLKFEVKKLNGRMMGELLKTWSSKHDMKDFNLIHLLRFETLVHSKQIVI
jgi:CCR4-NOT transcriptional regulation complex NOT5 subunit